MVTGGSIDLIGGQAPTGLHGDAPGLAAHAQLIHAGGHALGADVLDALVMAIMAAASLDVAAASGAGRQPGFGSAFALLPGGMGHKGRRQRNGPHPRPNQRRHQGKNAGLNGLNPGLGTRAQRKGQGAIGHGRRMGWKTGRAATARKGKKQNGAAL